MPEIVTASRAHKNELRGGTQQISPSGEGLDLSIADSKVDEAEVKSNTPVVPRDWYDESELANFISEEILKSEGERSQLIQDFERFTDIYRAKTEGVKNWPFKHASNIKVPLAKEFIDTQTAALSQTVLIPGPTWIMKNTAEEWRPFKNLIENFLDLSAKRELKLPDKVETWIREGLKLGTSILELSHEIIEKRFYYYDGDEPKPITKVVHSGPALWNVPIQDFYIPFAEMDIQDSPWVAKRIRLNPVQLKLRAANGQFDKDAVEKLLKSTAQKKHQGADDPGDVQETDDLRDKHERLENTEPTERKQLDIFEVWLSWNLDDDTDVETELQLYVHPWSRTLLSVRFNPYRHGMRPFVVFRPLPTEYRFYGESYCERLEPFQLEVSAIRNQRRDNATVANIRMFSVRRTNPGLKPGDGIWAGKVVFRDSADDILPLQLGDIYPSTVQEEQVAIRNAERVIGISEANTRGGFPVTRTTAGAQFALLQEQAKRLDNTIRNLREGIAEIGNMLLLIYMQYRAGSKPEAWLGKRGRILHGIFSLDYETVEQGIGLEASAPTSQLNREAQRQNSIALFNLMTQMYTQLIQMLQGLQPDPIILSGVLGALVSSAKQFMFDVLDQFDVTNPEEILSGLTFMEQILPSPQDFGGLDQLARDELNAKMLDKLDDLKDILRQSVQITGEARSLSQRPQPLLGRGNGTQQGGPQAPQGAPEVSRIPGL